MESGEKVGVMRKGKKQEEFMGTIKLKRSVLVGRRGGICTPPPTWKLGFVQPDGCVREDLIFPTTKLSARKLGANLWEVLPQLMAAPTKMSKGGGAGLPRRRHSHHHHHHQKDKGFQLPNPNQLDVPPNCPHEEPAVGSSLIRHVEASLIQHRRSVERNGHALRPDSPASYSSSMEVAPYNRAVTPSSSLDFKGRIGESSFNLKTSTELLKILNHIWSLEERNASNRSLVNALKRELDHCRAQIKELLREKQRKRQEMDELMKRVAAKKIVRKNKERDRIKAVVQSVREELEDERKLRKHSESFHRKLARELSDFQTSSSTALKELEREKKARILLEDLCDEFAKGIRDYEQKLQSLKHKPENDHAHRESPDRLILHLSEAWLDGRMQMKLAEPQYDLAEKNTIVDKLSLEIETFLHAKHSIDSINRNDSASKMPKETSLIRHSLESFHWNGAASAPHNADDEEDSTSSDSNCFELNRASSRKQSNGSFKQKGDDDSEIHLKEQVKSDPTKKKVRSREVVNDQPILQMQNEQLVMAGVMSCNGSRTKLVATNLDEIGKDDQIELINSPKLEITEGSKGEGDKKNKHNHVLTNIIRNHSLSLERGKLHEESNCRDHSCGRFGLPGHASPVQPWVSRFTTPDIEASETSRGSTLKAKLLEARLEGRRSQLKASKGSQVIG